MFCRSSSSSSPSSSSSLPCSAQNPRPHPHAFHSASPTAQCTPTLDYNDPQFPHMATYQSPEDDAELERKLQENDRIQRIRNEMRKHHQGGDNLLDPQFPQVIEKVEKSKVEWTAMLQEMEAKALRDEEREKKGERVADIIDLEILEIVEDYGYVDSLPESQWYDYIGGDSDSAEEEEEEEDDDDDDDDSAKEEDEEDGKSDSVQRSNADPNNTRPTTRIDTVEQADATAKTKRPRRPWTAEDTALMVELADQGVPYAAIAERLGRTDKTVAARIKYVKERPAERQSYRIWTPEDNALLLSLRDDEKLDFKTIAERLGRNQAQAVTQHNRLKKRDGRQSKT